MAQKVTRTLIDDIDGTEATETVRLGLDGVDYIIDLSDENVRRLRNGLSPFMQAARRTGGRRSLSYMTGQAKTPRATDTKAAREWARTQGYTISARGRVPIEILQKYREVTR